MTDSSQTKSKGGIGKLAAAIISAGVASYIVNRLSLNGVDFTALGVSSEIVKASLVGTLVGFLTGLTPQHVVDEMATVIVFFKNAFKQLRNAWRSN
jgi:hypothetical protein